MKSREGGGMEEKMKLRKILCVFLAAAMSLSIVACGGNAGGGAADTGSGTSSADTAGGAESQPAGEAEGGEEAAESDAFAGLPDTLTEGIDVVATPEMYPNVDLSSPCNINMYMVGDTPNDWDMVVEAANEYLKPFNTTLSATFLSWADYQTLYPLALQGDDCDIIYTASWCFLGSEAAKGSYHELTDDFIQTYMPLTGKYQAPDSYAEVRTGGKIYCIPQNMTEASAKFVAIRQDLAEKYGIGKLENWEDYKNYLKTIAEKETPESGIYAYAAATDNNELWDVYRQQYELRTVVANDLLCLGYTFDGTDTPPAIDDIQLIYQTDVFKNFCYDMKELADAGCWSRGALTNSITDDEAFGALQGASVAWNSSVFTYIDTAEKTEGVECAVYDLSPNATTAAAYGAGGMALAEGSKNLERAAMVLDIMENDTYLNRLLILGVEGVHYEMSDSTHYTELEKSVDYPIWGIAASWAIKNVKLIEEGQDPRREAIEADIESRGVPSPTNSFSFDETEISDYSAALKTVLGEYVYMLQLGLVDDVDATIDEMMEKLEASGLQTYLDAFKTQYEAWYAEQ